MAMTYVCTSGKKNEPEGAKKTREKKLSDQFERRRDFPGCAKMV